MATEAVQKTDEKKTDRQTLVELRNYDGELYVQNTSHKFYSIRHRVGQERLDLELTPAGTPDSIAPLPKLALALRGFQRAWKRGELVVSTDPDMEDTIDLLMNQHVKAADKALDDKVAAALAPSNTHKMVAQKACLECGRINREGVIEGGTVVQSASDIKEGVPPLCDEHVDATHLWSRTLKTDTKGDEYWDFNKITVK